jgi:ATP-dependent Clp protease ATP-binding subunit ClpA
MNAVSTILKTPLAIYDSVRKHFEAVQLNINLNSESLSVTLHFAPQLPDATLTCAVETRGFEKALEELKKKALQAQQGVAPVLDLSRCSLQIPLTDWQQFRREMYRRQGLDCVGAIVNYLQGTVPEQNLKDLGLAPEQIEKKCTDVDRVYFQELITKIGAMDSQLKGIVREAFITKYPNVSQTTFTTMAEQIKGSQTEAQVTVYEQIVLTLQKEVIGQDRAIKVMAATLASQRNQPDNNRVFLFVGPSGVGKTELAKAASKVKEGRCVSFAMNQYQGSMDYSKFLGAGSGLVGSTDKPHFAKEIEKYTPELIGKEGSKAIYKVSKVVILFDEFEKACSKVKQSLLTLFDEGYCDIQYTDEYANVAIRYVLKSCIIVNTSNLFQREIYTAFQNLLDQDQIVKHFKQLNAEQPYGTTFSPELLNRMTIIPFGPIPAGECYQKLIQLKFGKFTLKLKTELGCKEIEIEHEKQILVWLEQKLYGEGTDIRCLERYFDQIKQEIYKQSSKLGSLTQQKLTFTYENGAAWIKCSTYLAALEMYYVDPNTPKLPLP